MALAPGADFISLKDEYRNMADDKLPLTNDPLPNIQTNKAGFGTDLTVGDKYENLINIKGAKFLDLYRGSIKIDDADDLKEALKSYDVEMSIAFNDNPDNDEFRKAYIVVITNLKDKDTTTPEQPSTGVIRFDTSITSKYGKITDPEIEIMAGSGRTYASFELEMPEWAASPNVTAGDIVKLDYALYVDDVLYARVTGLQNSNNGTAASSLSALIVDKTGANNASKFTLSNFELTASGNGLNAADIQGGGHKVEMVITNIEWQDAKVQVVDEEGKLLNLDSTGKNTTTLPTTSGDEAKVEFKLNTLSTVKGAFDLENVIPATSGAAVTDLAMNTNVAAQQDTQTNNGGLTVRAAGGDYVNVVVKPAKPMVTEYTVTVSTDDVKPGSKGLDDGVVLADHWNVSKDGGDVAETMTLAVASNVVGTVKEGGQFSVKLTTTGTIADTAVAKYVVTLTLGDQSRTAEFTAADAKDVTFENIDQNWEITADMIDVTPVYKPHATAVEVQARKVVVTFDQKIDKDTLADSDITLGGGATAKVESWDVTGNTLTIYFKTADLADTNTITVAANKLASVSDSSLKNIVCNITVDLTDGSYEDSSFANH